MDYKINREILTELVESREVIWPSEIQKKADGSFDLESNHRIWNTAISKFRQIQLWENGAPNFDEKIGQPQPSIIFVPSPSAKVRGTIIVAHGGGFEARAGHEGFHVADYFNKAGFAVAILTYRLRPYTRFDAIVDMQRAIRTLRARSGELGISDKVAVMGFSAGGMLSSNCATHFDRGNENAADPIERYSCRPDAAAICYGAFSSVAFPGPVFTQPFGDPKRAEQVYLAPDKNITPETPPFFIWQTISDDPRHSMNLAKELTDVGIPFELHCFTDGFHGLGLADGANDQNVRIPHLMHWSELCAEWLESQDI